MTPERAHKINRAAFFAVVIYIIVVCFALALGDRGVMAFTIIAAFFGAFILAYVVWGVPSLVALILMLLFLIIGRKDTALRVSEKIDKLEQGLVGAILPPKDSNA